MKLSEFDYSYPEELIATHPLKNRDQSRMMVVKREDQSLTHHHIVDFISFLKKGDLVVLNDTKVFPARLVGRKVSGGKIEILLLSEKNRFWRAITNQTARLKKGSRLDFDGGLFCNVIEREGEEILVEFNDPKLIDKVGLPPLPPYILKARNRIVHHFLPSPLGGEGVGEGADRDRYQTVYAKHLGSAAAPTAGLHFTSDLLEKIRGTGAETANITLHVGLDTFSPVREENIQKHKIHGEEYSIPQKTIDYITDTKKNGGKVIAVGTTSVRALESIAPLTPSLPLEGGGLGRGWHRTNLFITPGYKFHTVDAMLTNFHQPKSTLLMLVSAFAGKELILKAYKEAITQKYRLFSYGDCMLIT